MKKKQLKVYYSGLPILISYISQKASEGDKEAQETLARWDIYREKASGTTAHT